MEHFILAVCTLIHPLEWSGTSIFKVEYGFANSHWQRNNYVWDSLTIKIHIIPPPPQKKGLKSRYLMRVAEPTHQLTGNGALQSGRASLNSLEAPLSPPPRPSKRLSRCQQPRGASGEMPGAAFSRAGCLSQLGESFLPPNQMMLHGF